MQADCSREEFPLGIATHQQSLGCLIVHVLLPEFSFLFAIGPQILTWEDLTFYHEVVDDKTGDFQHTTFAMVDEDDTAYFGKSSQPRRNLTFTELTSALVPISDDEVFPRWEPYRAVLTQAQDTLLSDTYIKRPNLSLYDIFQEHNVVELIPKDLLEEAQVMEMISKTSTP